MKLKGVVGCMALTDRVLGRVVESIDHGWRGMLNPASLVDGLVKFTEHSV